jgi:hypothetical protein
MIALTCSAWLTTSVAVAQELPALPVTGTVSTPAPPEVTRSAIDRRRLAHVIVRGPEHSGEIRMAGELDSGSCRGRCVFDLVPGRYAVDLDRPRIAGVAEIPTGRSFLYLRQSTREFVIGGAVLLGLGVAATLVPFVGMAATPWFLFTGIITWPLALAVMVPGIVLLALSGPRVTVHDSDPDPPPSTWGLLPRGASGPAQAHHLNGVTEPVASLGALWAGAISF